MLVYGDREECLAPEAKLSELARLSETIRRANAGLQRHSALVTLLIEGGRLLQGLADVDFVERRSDRRTPGTEAICAFLVEIGAAVCRSWDSNFADVGELPSLPELGWLPAQAALREPEGYAFYGLYPEAYIEAARKVRLHGLPRVIGIRSIGTSLGPVVAAAVGAPTPLTVRPFGDPAARQVSIEGEAVDRQAHYLIVDEGPGQSGSSFVAVARWLEQHGIASERITLLPSHAGAPSRGDRESWQKWHRQPADLSPRLPDLVRSWSRAAIGEAELTDISGGGWRRVSYAAENNWPPVQPLWERRKFLAANSSGKWLIKFAGLGLHARRKLARARALHEHGLSPRPEALAHGFLIQRWEEGQPLTRGEKPIAEIAAYIGAVAQLFPGGSGASAAELLNMARRNVSLALGQDWARELEVWLPQTAALEAAMQRVAIDGRMDPHEWIRTADGRLLKTDALDHHASHDVVGCQDIAWDIAGAVIEFGLNDDEAATLVRSVEADIGRVVDMRLLDFLMVAYLAFRCGQVVMSIGIGVPDPADEQRLQRTRDRYQAALCRRLSAERLGNDRPDSSAGVSTKRNHSGNNPQSRAVEEEDGH